jgi:hypothetical protein
MAAAKQISSEQEPTGVHRPLRYRRIKQIGMLAGLLLLLAAIAVALGQRDNLTAAREAIRAMPATQLAQHLAVLAGSVALNLALTGALFSVLISRYGRVGIVEMQALIASATLLNYVPLRPGLFGRLAYHRAYNSIPLTNSVKTVLQAAFISSLVAAYLALASMLAARGLADLRVMALAPPPLLFIAAFFWRRARVWLAAVGVRWLELLVIAARYHAAFALIGSPIDATTSVALACVSMIAALVPFLSNGLGLREWAVGLLAPLLTSCDMTQAMTADLVNRAAELIVVLIAGLAGISWLMHHRRARHGRKQMEA